MAKRRSWHFYTFIISFSVILGLYLLWAYTPLKKGVELRIIRSLQPYLGESFYINDFSLGLTSVSFYGVRTADDSTFSLEIDEIRIGLIREKLFTTEIRPTHLIESVTVINPNVTLFYHDAPRKKKGQIPLDSVFQEILTNIRKFPEIDHITIKDGEINLQLPWGRQVPHEQKQIPLFNKLGGLVTYIAKNESAEFNFDNEEINLDLRGEFLGTKNSSVNLKGTVDFTKNEFSANLNLDECVFTSNYPFWKLDYLLFENALLKGNVKISSNSFTTDSLQMDGNIHAKDIALTIYNQHVKIPECTFRLNRKAIILDSLRCEIEDGVGRFSGTVDNVLQPEADWQLSFSGVSAKYLKQSHDIFQYAYEGKISGDATFKGPFKLLDVEASLRCPNLLFGVVPFNTVRTQLKYNTNTKLLNFNYVRADFFKFRTRGNGWVNFKKDTLDFSLYSDIDIPSKYFSILNGLNGGKVLLDTDFKGNFIHKKFGGKFYCQALSENDSLFVAGQGPFTLDDQLFDFNLYSDDLADNLALNGTIENVFSDPYVEILGIKDFPAEQLTEYDPIAKFLSGRNVNYYFSGPYHSLSAKMKIVSEKNPLKNIVDVNGHIKDLFFDDQRFRGKFVANTEPQELNGKFDVAFSVDGVETQIEVPGVLNSRLNYGYQPDAPLYGKVRIPRFSLSNYLENSDKVSEIIEDGILDGSIDLSGTMRDPQIDFDLNLQEFIVNGVGYYNSHISGSLENQLLTFDDLWMRLNSDSVINANLTWNIASDSMNLKASAKNVESNFLAETIFEDPGVIQGKVTYNLIAKGIMQQPSVYGDIQLKDGFLKGNPFHSIYLSVEDSLFPGTDFWNLNSHVLKVRDFLYDNPNAYQFIGKGIFSLDEYRPLDFEVDIQGNVLQELPKIQPYFLSADSKGRIRAHVQGTRVNPTFKELQMEIFDGSITFDGILPRLTNLKADIELAQENNFVQIKSIEGMLDGRWAKVYNEPAASVNQENLMPWILEDPDLDFGILVLETDQRGIPLSIPGLMEDGEKGYFAARGQTRDEKFYFARYGLPEDSVSRGIRPAADVVQGFISPFMIAENQDEQSLSEDSTRVENGNNLQVEQSLQLLDNKKPIPRGTPIVRGETVLYDARVTFPFIGMYDESVVYEDNPAVDFLMNMEWDLKAVPGNNVHYFVGIPAYVGDVFMDLNIDDTSPGLHFTGRIIDEEAFEKDESTFKITGSVRSTRGRVEYLDVNFRVEEFGADFKGYEIYPNVYGTAYTTVRSEPQELLASNSTTQTQTGGGQSIPRDIYLQLYVTDPVTGLEATKGRWEDFRFKLMSKDNVIGETQEQILALMGYSVENLQYKAGEVGLTMTDNMLIRPLYRPIERQLERRLRLDHIRLRTHFASNLFYMSFQGRAEFFNRPTFAVPNYNLNSALLLLQSSEVTMGKYLLEDFYFTYKAELVAGYEESKLGVNHTWGVEYRVLYNLLLEVELTRFQFNPFYSDEINDDVRIRLRHSFNF